MFTQPIGYVPFSSDAELGPGVQEKQLAILQKSVDTYNQGLMNQYLGQVANWTMNAMNNRALGAPLPPKPAPGTLEVVSKIVDPDTGTIWVMTSLTGAPAGPPCPDLPPLPTPSAPGTIDFGTSAGWPYWHVGPADNMPLGGPPFRVQPTDTFPSGQTVPPGMYQLQNGAMTSLKWYKWLSPLLLLFALLAYVPAARAQVTIACSPQPMAATRSIGEKVMGPWSCWVTNDGAVAYTLTPSKFYQAILAIRPVGPNQVNQIIADSVNGLPQSRALRVGKVIVSLAAVGYGLYSGNATVPLAATLGMQSAPQILSVIEGTVPSGAGFTVNQMVAPVTIPPGGDVPPVLVYAMKTPNPQPITVLAK